MDFSRLNIKDLLEGYVARHFSVKEVVEWYLSRIKKTDDKVHSYLTVTAVEAIQRAEELDYQLKSGAKLTPLFGVPVSIKDVIITKGIKTTAASKVLEDYLPPYQATVVEKLVSAGAIILGKTNCDEFAMGASNEKSGFGPTRNPWNLDYVPGGSSGGSAAAVASGQCALSLGSDTAGSIRQPAAFCGIVGLKPTYGRVSRYGLIAMTSSLDHIGPMTRTVDDAAAVLQVIAGPDKHDATSVNYPLSDLSSEMKKSIKGLRVGVPKEFFGDGLNKKVAQSVRQAIDVLTSLGVQVQSVSLPTVKYAVPTYYVLAPAEISANMARFDGLRYGQSQVADDLFSKYIKTRGDFLGAEVKRRIILGTYVLSAGYYEAYYKQAVKVGQQIKKEFTQVFKEVDALAAPTSPTTAFAFGSRNQDPLAMYLEDVYTVPANIAGLPAISLPCGLIDGLPVGWQLIGRHWQESIILSLAKAYEQAVPWQANFPKLD
ncbi:Asp-tRNA(Asn)/Glu-tRNA(Gln) amidotransferase subunit GatA [Patescibacteria group bacterium]|nr:Asp-tRNA(Asn)/Glu-tRNA(Gln) amidotransferase subunit GatA [Patescibacteria group bacterium]